jgi:hypothetical protein
MANSKQRRKNRETAKGLKRKVRSIELSKHVCENCGEMGGHWVSTRGLSLMAMITGQDDQEGFWTCSKYYDPETKRRLPGV